MELQRWDVTTDQWRKDPNGIWVKADDAIRREVELLRRIQALEARTIELIDAMPT
jgi:hypothetical protein